MGLVCRVDLAVSFDDADPSEILKILRPNCYFLGSDYFGQTIPGAEHCGHVVFVERIRGVSTTEIISRGRSSERDLLAADDRQL